MFEKMREPVSGLTHLFTAIAAVAGLATLLIVSRQAQPGKQVSLFIYGASLVLMFSSSAAYHLVQSRPEVIQSLRKLDHSAIYILIAGTYTPFCFNLLSGYWKWGSLAVVWSLAVAGIVSKMFMIHAPRWLAAGIYLAMGWLAVFGLQEALRVVPTGALVWLLLGGVVYTIGAVVYITKIMDFAPGVFGHHETWHIFVMLASLCHYLAVLIYVAPPGTAT